MTLNKQWRNKYGKYNFNNADNGALGMCIFSHKK